MYIFDDHDKEGQFDAECFFLVFGAGDEGRRDVSAHDLQHGRLNILVSESLDVAVVN